MEVENEIYLVASSGVARTVKLSSVNDSELKAAYRLAVANMGADDVFKKSLTNLTDL